MNTRLIITVTSAKGQPTLTLPGHLSTRQVGDIVRGRFGMQTDGNSPAIPHSYCGAIVPPPAPREGPSLPAMLSQRGHFRVV
jgi:hypothetical protein